MSMFTEQNSAMRVRSFGFGFSLQGLADRATRYVRFRKTLNELRGLSDRELADLGLNRAMLPRIAQQAVYES